MVKVVEKKNIIKIILIIIWMAVVFSFSSENGGKSTSTSREVTNIIVDRVVPNKTREEKDEIVINVDKVTRKLAHYTLYTIGGFLIINYIYTWDKPTKNKIVCSILCGAIYAATDELHQYFVGGRSAQVTDVLIDTLGVITGILIYLGIRKVIQNIKS